MTLTQGIKGINTILKSLYIESVYMYCFYRVLETWVGVLECIRCY